MAVGLEHYAKHIENKESRKFVELKTKSEPDSVYFEKSTEFKPQQAIVVKGSGGKEYFIESMYA